MQDYQSLETSVLIDLLAQHTAQYTNKISEKTNNAELGQYEYEIALIQGELNSRKMTPGNTSISDPTIEIQPPTEPTM